MGEVLGSASGIRLSKSRAGQFEAGLKDQGLIVAGGLNLAGLHEGQYLFF